MNAAASIKQRFGLVGRSEIYDRALNTAARVAATDLTVLITGESGVGKEVFSQIIHNLSARKHNKFIAVNCGAIPQGTINSELFGHEKGSFTGAIADKKGLFEMEESFFDSFEKQFYIASIWPSTSNRSSIIGMVC